MFENFLNENSFFDNPAASFKDGHMTGMEAMIMEEEWAKEEEEARKAEYEDWKAYKDI